MPAWSAPPSRQTPSRRRLLDAGVVSVRDAAEIEVAQVAALGGHEDARHLGARERAGDRLLVGGAHDHRPALGMCGAELLLVAHAVEHERLLERNVVFALDGDLRHPPPRRPEPALPYGHTVTLSPGSGAITSTSASARCSTQGPRAS